MIHHIFIFSSHKGKEADELICHGFTEGSNRLHDGQGTANRKFYFRNFYLEILWVNQPSEIKKDKNMQIGLWQRSQFRNHKMSPFGLCLKRSNRTDALFQNSLLYQPDYLPEDKHIEVISNECYPGLPWTFRLPESMEDHNTNEPILHQMDVQSLTGVIFEGTQQDQYPVWSEYFQDHEMIRFKPASGNRLILTFDHQRQGKSVELQSLNLSIRF
jgi:hypothetical protein